MPVFRIKEATNLLWGQPGNVAPVGGGGRIETINDASGRLAGDGVALARLAQKLAQSPSRPITAVTRQQQLISRRET